MLLARLSKGRQSPRKSSSFGDKLALFVPQPLTRKFSDEVKLSDFLLLESTILLRDGGTRW